MKTKFKIIGLALALVAVTWVYREYGRNGVQDNIKILPISLNLDQGGNYDPVLRKEGSDSQELNPFHSSMEARQNARKRLVEEFCRKTGHNTMPVPRHIDVIESLNMLYCVTPKVGSRQWRAMLLRFTDGPPHETLLDYPQDHREHMLKNYFKFTFVREPFERLLSAYKDKFVYIRGIDHRMLKLHGREILKHFRPNATEHAREKLDDITFKEFIEYLVTKGSNESSPIMDWHWDNYLHTCGMCAMKYDFIGHYETFNQDIEDFKKAAKLSPDQAKRFKAQEKNISSTATSMLGYYSKLPLKWINKLVDLYRPTLEMFDYKFPGPLKTLFENEAN